MRKLQQVWSQQSVFVWLLMYIWLVWFWFCPLKFGVESFFAIAEDRFSSS